ncbi:hypothetical protein STENM223S_01611 [Streptomyces tendae]
MSLSAAVLFDRALKQTRRAALREQGLVPRPLPQIRMVRWLRAPRETYRAWSLMLLEGVRSLDEAVEEVRDDQRQKEEKKLRRREQERLERAQLKAISRGHGHRGFAGPRRPSGRGRGAAGRAGLGTRHRGACHIGPGTLPAATRRPSLQPVRSGSEQPAVETVDLTAEDDTQALPRLDSLERKLKDLEQQFG